VVSLVISFVGFSILVHRIGVRYTLLIFPIVMFIAVVITNLVPSLWALFVMVSVLKALVYSLNDPVVELLYMPTSEPIKFKAKAWIDVVGARSAKAIASIVTSLSAGDVNKLRRRSEIPMILISLIFIVIVWVTGREFDQLVKQKIIIGEELERSPEEIQERIERELKAAATAGAGGELKRVNGLLPGEVGYGGYDPEEVFEGVDFEIYSKDQQLSPRGSRTQEMARRVRSFSSPSVSVASTPAPVIPASPSTAAAALTRPRGEIQPFQMEDFSTPGSSKKQSIWR
jgi:hypothetical protein